MWRLKPKILLQILILSLKRIIESILIIIVLSYFILVFDIYINTEKLSKVDSSLNVFCQNISINPNFTKGSVVFRVDRGTLVYRLNFYVSKVGLYGYSPFFLFPYHRTVILTEEVLRFKRDGLIFKTTIAHELGHIQGGLKHLGPIKEMERYADDFATKVLKNQPQKEPQK